MKEVPIRGTQKEYEVFFMDREECRERILSEDYLDFISPVYRAVTQEEVEGKNVCAGYGFRVPGGLCG